MCRFTFYLGRPIPLSSIVTEPRHSLIRQSYQSQEGEEPLNGDGFGVAWYVPEMSREPALFRSITPAWNNSNLHELARVVQSPCVLAHVRAATQRLAVTEVNCHPFKSGRWGFMHNGDIEGFAEIRRPWLGMLSDRAFRSIEGTTDSEYFFAAFLDELQAQGIGGEEDVPVEAVAQALESTIRQVRELQQRHSPGSDAHLNLVVTNGQIAVACRFTSSDPEKADSLHLNHGRRYVCEEGVCRMEQPGSDAAVIVSSEELSHDPGWSTIPGNHLVLVAKGREVTVRPVSQG